MKTIRIRPVDVDKAGQPIDSKLGAAVQAFAEKEFGERLSFNYYTRVWAVLEQRDDDPEYFQVFGVSAIRTTLDCPIFHIVPPTSDKEGMMFAEQARDMTVYRLYSHLEDAGLGGQRILIYVSETAERYWSRFLRKLKAKKANRYELKI